MLVAARAGTLGVLYVVGADPASDYPDARAWDEARRRLGCLVVHDLFLTPTAAQADVVLPVLAYAEKTGTVGNVEGRVQRQDPAVLGPGTAWSDAQIVTALAARLGVPFAVASWEQVFAEIGRLIPGWAEGARLAPPGLEAPGAGPGEGDPAGRPGPTDAGRSARTGPGARSAPAVDPPGGELALVVGTRLFDRGTMALRCPGVRGQAGEPFVAVHPHDAARLGLADGAPCEVRSPRGALRLPARVWAGLHPGQAYVPRGYESAPVSTLLDEREPVAVTLRPLRSSS